MFDLFFGEIRYLGEEVLVYNSKLGFGVKGFYLGEKTEGEFWIVSVFDEKSKIFNKYFFDSFKQLKLFFLLSRISGVGAKIAFRLASLDVDKIKQALKDLDLSFFTGISGIGEKTARKILLELGNGDILEVKEKFKQSDIESKVIKILAGLGYEKNKIKEELKNCPIKKEKENISQIINWIVKKM